MDFEIALTLGTVVVLFILFVKQTAPAEILALGAVAVLMMAGILSTADILGVLSNGAAMTVAVMFILSAALEKTGVIDTLGRATIRLANKSMALAIIATFAVVFLAGAFINNTPVVVIMIPVIIMLAKKVSVAPSKLLIPLSYMTILGGTCTLIGTSTNLLVDGVAQDMGLAPFGMFEITIPGLALAAAGMVYLTLFGRKLLPDRQSLSDVFDARIKRKYLSQITLNENSPLIGKTLGDTPLTRDEDIEIIQHIPLNQEEAAKPFNFLSHRYTAGIFRRKFDSASASSAEAPDMATVLQEGDRIVIMSTQRNALTFNLDSENPTPSTDNITSDQAVVMEGIIAPRSNLAGRSIDNFNLSDLYPAQIIALHRPDGTIITDFNTARLSVGDTILLKGDESVLVRLFEENELVNLTKPELEPFQKKHAPIAIAVMMTVILLATLNIMPIAGAAFIGAVAVILTGCLKPQDAYKSLQGNVLFLIYAMLAISVAMQETGALELVVNSIFTMVAGLPPIVVLSLLYFITSAVTEVFSNNASALMLTPIAIGLAVSMGIDPRAFAAAIMFGASASFATPIGYQTNTMVFHAGGYQFKDFLRIGMPLNLIMWAVATIVIPWYWEF